MTLCPQETWSQLLCNASKEEIWDLTFNRFGEVNLFNSNIESSHYVSEGKGVGCERQCDLDANTSVQERITAARGTDSFDIDIIEGGLPNCGARIKGDDGRMYKPDLVLKRKTWLTS